MRTLAALIVAVAGLMGSIPAAAAQDHYNYKNPANPSKNPNKLRDSQYRGWHYEKRWETYRRCVMARESGGNYKANSTYGSGAYQFIQSTWDVAMDASNHPEWIGVRPHKAPPYIQDEAFWITANPFPKKKALHGRHHWSAAHALTIGATVKDC